MKKFYILFIVIFFFLACNKKGQHSGSFQIKGTIAGFDSSYVVLKNIVEGELNTIDSIYTPDGKFLFEGNVYNPELCFLIFGDIKHHVNIFLENSLITFSAHIDSLDNSTITGSKSHSEFKSYEDEIHPFENKMADLYQQYKAASDQNNKLLVSQVDSLREALKKDMDDYIKNYIGTHKSSLVSPYILTKIANHLKISELDSLLQLLDKSLDESFYTQNLKERLQILKKTETGKKAPEFAIADTTGNDFSLSEYKGKIILILLWAAWNEPSRRENKNLQTIYKEYNLRNFEIVGISLDNDRGQWAKAIKDDNLAWKQGSDLKFWKSEVVKMYGISKIPSNVLINKDGIIIGKNLNREELLDKLNEMLL